MCLSQDSVSPTLSPQHTVVSLVSIRLLSQLLPMGFTIITKTHQPMYVGHSDETPKAWRQGLHNSHPIN